MSLAFCLENGDYHSSESLQIREAEMFRLANWQIG